jgi:alkylation response protein AidB-like acyl-CoA dehydrogenase
MELGFTDDEDLLRQTAREFSKGKLEPFLAGFPDEPLPRAAVLELFGLIQPFGILSARLPKEAGGEGMTNVQLGILYEEFPAEVSMAASTNDLVGFRLYHGGSEELRSRYLARLAEGSIVGASAISEPDAGSDISNISTKAEPVDGGYALTGTKLWSSGAVVADILLVAATLGRDDRGRSVTGRLIVDKAESELTVRELDMLGLRRHGMGEVFFDGCRVPRGNMIGTPGDGAVLLAQSWLGQRALIGMIGVRLAQEALDASIRFAKARSQFGRTIASFQLVQEMIVDMAVLTDTSRYLCYRALHLLDRGRPSRFASSVAKAYATEAAVKVTSMAIQIHGAMGLSREDGLEKLFRDARMLPIPDGTTQIQKLIAGRELLGVNAIRN